MITEHMRLNSRADARQWASSMGDLTDEQNQAVADHIWASKPTIGCTYEEWSAANENFDLWEVAE